MSRNKILWYPKKDRKRAFQLVTIIVAKKINVDFEDDGNQDNVS